MIKGVIVLVIIVIIRIIITCCRDAADPSWDGVRGARENKSSRGMECVVRGRVVGGSVSICDDAGLK